MTLKEARKQAVVQALRKTNGNRWQASEILKCSVKTVRNVIRECNLEEFKLRHEDEWDWMKRTHENNSE